VLDILLDLLPAIRAEATADLWERRTRLERRKIELNARLHGPEVGIPEQGSIEHNPGRRAQVSAECGVVVRELTVAYKELLQRGMHEGEQAARDYLLPPIKSRAPGTDQTGSGSP
jgi:hypothetical protein